MGRGVVILARAAALALALLGGAAHGQDVPASKPRKVVQPPVAAPVPAGPDLVAPPTAPSAAPPVLRSAVRSRWSSPAAIGRGSAAQCRTQCGETRLTCLSTNNADDGYCNAAWTRCLLPCAGLTYGRGP